MPTKTTLSAKALCSSVETSNALDLVKCFTSNNIIISASCAKCSADITT